jgi:HK97 family phage prohead protease
MLLGRAVNGEGTLSIWFDEKGGYFEVEKPNTSTGNDVYENIRLKNIRGCSFAFTVAEQSVEYDVAQPDGSMATVININKVKRLYDVGPVLNPAYVETEVEASMRSRIEKEKPSKYTLEEQITLVRANLI